MPYRQPLFDSWTVRPMYIAVRTAGEPLAAAAAIRHQVNRLDPDQPIANVRTMDERIARSLSGRRFNMVMLGVFVILAQVLRLDGDRWWRQSTLMPYGESIANGLRAVIGDDHPRHSGRS